ncbi:protein phosphatase 1 regulatory subunit 3C-like [Tropilaelaps mercedesae]|uniref:Protein phosphatase 1 regulatory subunit 3C-like n=1 Tax=Tropilaelaps mercedesae TaxID=418985 RepID=A0A1V9XP70_9ACAR|nr:protein phosphatase 1 regulatory subunit 3C-like [Tropilaelaps mercedesae]
MTAVQIKPNPNPFLAPLSTTLVWTDYRTGSSAIDLHIIGCGDPTVGFRVMVILKDPLPGSSSLFTLILFYVLLNVYDFQKLQPCLAFLRTAGFDEAADSSSPFVTHGISSVMPTLPLCIATWGGAILRRGQAKEREPGTGKKEMRKNELVSTAAWTRHKPENLRAHLPPAHEISLTNDNTPKRCLKSAPQTPTKSGQPKKIVKFADDMGLDLTAVKVMVATPPSQSPEEIPAPTPSLAVPTRGLPITMVSITTTTCPMKTALISSKEFLSTRNTKLEICQSTGRYQAKFEQPGATAHFWQRLRAQKVCLESVIASYNSSVHIVVRVLNVAFHKSVVLRYTLNNWGSYTDIEADYLPAECKDITGSAHASSPTDRFSVNLCLKSSPRSVQFCVCYRVDGKEYWDNNNHQNYRMEFEESQQPTPFY